MSILLIKYAVAGCTADQVTHLFNYKFNGQVVDRVVTINKVNYTTGAPFHMFFIHLSKTRTPELTTFLEDFTNNTVQRVIYDHPWYWNVVVAEPRVPHIQDPDINKAVANMPAWMKP